MLTGLAIAAGRVSEGNKWRLKTKAVFVPSVCWTDEQKKPGIYMRKDMENIRRTSATKKRHMDLWSHSGRHVLVEGKKLHNSPSENHKDYPKSSQY